MEMHTISNGAADFDNLKCSLSVQSLVAETAVLADKSLLFLILLVWSSINKNNIVPNSVKTEQRFPTSDLNKLKEPDAENNDAGEAEDDKDSDDDDEDEGKDSNEDNGNDSEKDSDDDEEDSDDELEAAGYGDSDDEDDDEDDDDDSDVDDDDSDEDEDEDDDHSEDDEERFKLPSQRKK